MGRVWRISLYFTGWKHAGNNLGEVLKQRATAGADPDVRCAVAQHAQAGRHRKKNAVMCWRRCGVYHHDAQARDQELSPEERLRFHQEHSGPLMQGLHACRWPVGPGKGEPNCTHY